MTDLISRQAAIGSAISGRVRALPTTEDGEDWIRVSEVRESLLNLPSAEPQIGEWIYPTDIIGFGRCGNCKALWDIGLIRNKFFRYCPRCGARMSERRTDE